MSRKIKITAVAIFATLTFATTAFAGIFDVVGAVVGGVLGVQTTTTTQSQLENFHKSYLEKSAARILETGSVDTAFNEMVEEQKKIGSTVKVTEPDADHKIAEISGGDLPVIVKCLVNKKTQTITISYLRSDGMPTGNVLTKKYELPAGAAASAPAPAAPSDDGPSPFANVKQQSGNPFANATPTKQTQGSCASGISSAEMNAKFSIIPNNSLNRNEIVEYICPNGQTGCPAFDSSPLKGNVKFIKAAYLAAKINQNDGYSHLHTDSYVERLCDQYVNEKNDPFIAPQIKNACKQLIAYCRAGGQLDYRLYNNIDCVTKNPLSIDTCTDDSRHIDTYKLATETYILAWPPYEYMCYDFKIPSSQMSSAFNQLQNIVASNQAAIKRVKENAYKKNFQKQKITLIRFSKGFDTPIDEYGVYSEELPLMRNAYLSIRLLDGFVTYKNYELRYEFPNTQWKELLGYTAVDAVKKKK